MKYQTVKLGKYVSQIRGLSYKPSEIEDTPLVDHVAILKANNITERGLEEKNMIYIRKSRVRPEQFIRKGDILLAASSGSKEIVGKNIVFDDDYPGTFGAFCKVVRPHSDLQYSYLKHFFQTPTYQRHIRKFIQGANINNLRNEHIDDLKIPFPSLPDQIRIATILSKAESLIAQRKESLRLLDELLKSTFLEMFGDPITNTKNLPSKAGKELFVFSSGKFNPKENLNDKYVYPCFGGNGITGYSQDYLIDFDTLVIGRVGAYCGNIHLVRGKNWVTDNAIFIKEFKNKQDLTFLYYLLKLLKLNRFADTAGQPKITQGPLESLKYIDVDISQQIRFSTIAEEANVLKAHYQTSLKELENLYGSLSQRAFNGELDLSRMSVEVPEEIARVEREKEDEEKVIERVNKNIEHFHRNLPYSGAPAEIDNKIRQLDTELKVRGEVQFWGEYAKYRILKDKLKGRFSYVQLRDALLTFPFDKKLTSKDIQEFILSLLEGQPPFIEQIFDVPPSEKDETEKEKERQIMFRVINAT